MAESKTSTFTVHHERCDPNKWTARDIIAFANFVRTGNLQYAAHLSRLGVQLVLSEHHEPKGGTLQAIGWVAEDHAPNCGDGVSDDLQEIADDDDITAVVPIYRGPVEYVVRFATGDGEGNFEGWEHEIKPTEAEAEAFLKSLVEDGKAA